MFNNSSGKVSRGINYYSLKNAGIELTKEVKPVYDIPAFINPHQIYEPGILVPTTPINGTAIEDLNESSVMGHSKDIQ